MLGTLFVIQKVRITLRALKKDHTRDSKQESQQEISQLILLYKLIDCFLCDGNI